MGIKEKLVAIPVPREHFVAERYERWVLKKAQLEAMEKSGIAVKHMVYMTDLDKVYTGDTKTASEIILCDHCNEDILDDNVLMDEDNGLVWHKLCVPQEWVIEDFMAKVIAQFNAEKLMNSNVISIFSRRIQK